ncbi:MAG: helicase-exonuclease AddAB subunit AddA [Mollicutes bacterium]|nr:helicase-exonuclease AddAB subunit AddA [Mollicutes bacterium]
MIKWTSDQEQAINKRGGKIIVSAAAGSGKTAVLAERVIQYILNGGDISHLLIVTFTTLAASEMKERIKSNIEESLKNDPSNKHLIKQASLVTKAKIMTMDSFYNNIIRENFWTLGINPNFKVIDEIEYSLLKEEVIRDLIDSKIETSSIIKLLDNFSDDKNGFTIEKLIIDFNDFINKMPFPLKWLDKIKDSYQINSFNKSIWSKIFYQDLLLSFNSYITLYQDILDEISYDDVLYERLYLFFSQELNLIKSIKEFIIKRDLDSLYTSIKGFNFEKFPSIRGTSDHPLKIKAKNMRDNFKKIIKNYQNMIDYLNKETFLNDLNEIQSIINELIDVTKEYREKLKERIKTENCLGFDDILHLVLDLLISNYDYETGKYEKTKYALDIANQFDEILIDEFQDTNMVQYLIFDCISKNQSNLFMVGDVKQSIYAFRSARPELLIKEKKKAFKEKFPLLINLGQNFRSRKEVLNFCNYLFSKIMTEEFGEIKYDENEWLNLGAFYEPTSNIEPEIYLLTDDNEEDNDEDLTKVEREAVFVARKIKELINSNYQVYDNKQKVFRKLKLNDIAILLRSAINHSDTFRKALTIEGIDVYTETTPIYFDNYEVKLIIAFLQIINNPYDDIALTTVLRSPIFAFTTNQLYEIRRVDDNDYLYNNMIKINNEKINDFINKIEKYRSLINELSIYQLINYIYNDTKILAIFSHMDNGHERVKNLLEMTNYANRFMDNDNHTLYEFIRYIETLIENKDSLMGANPTSEKDSVLITTIHKSKGLEFPIVFLPTLDKRFNFKDLNEDILMDVDYYLGFKIRDFNEHKVNSNLILELLKKHKLNKQLAEELRILYVGLTRAKEKLIMTASVNNLVSKCENINSLISNDDKIKPSYLLNTSSYLDWILTIILKSPHGKILRDLANIETKLYNDDVDFKVTIINSNNYQSKEVIKPKEKVNINLDDLIQRFRFNQSDFIVNYQTKITATKLKENSNNYYKPSFIEEKIGFDIGTIYHKIMEHLPFIKYDSEGLTLEIEKLVNNGIITKEELEQINIQKIINFFMTDLYYNTIVNSTYYSEYNISFNALVKEIDSKIDSNDTILVEGIIDLLCIYNEEYIIIDYKTDIVNSEEELINRYQKQLELYELGIKKIYNTSKVQKYIYSFTLGKFVKI